MVKLTSEVEEFHFTSFTENIDPLEIIFFNFIFRSSEELIWK